ncbi:MAG: zinc ribbon domain-containing protein, partial [Chromatocurvus sp.]
MTDTEKMRRRLRLSRPSLRRDARPPRLRTAPGEAFSAANLPCALALRHCRDCGGVQYPPQEVCAHCLGDE